MVKAGLVSHWGELVKEREREEEGEEMSGCEVSELEGGEGCVGKGKKG